MINNVTLFDCTLREIGYQTGWYFDKTFSRSLYKFMESKGIDYVELGFFHNLEADKGRGPFRYCSSRNEDILDVFEQVKGLSKISAMRDIQRPLSTLIKKSETIIDTIRILTRSKETDFAVLENHIEEIQTLGYEVFVNFTSSGFNSIDQNIAFARFAKRCGVNVIYFADTESIFTPDYVINTIDACRSEGIEPGIHLHNKNGTGEMLLEVALSKNCRYTDMTLLGLGGKWHDGNISTEHVFRKFGVNNGYEFTHLKTELIQQLIKYHSHNTAVL